MKRRSAPKGASPSPAAKPEPCPDRSGPRFEYCVRWRRLGWQASTQDKVKTFGTLVGAGGFRAKLLNLDGRPDLSVIEWVRIERREVGEWEVCG